MESGKTLVMPKIKKGDRRSSDNSDEAIGKRLKLLRLAFGKTQRDIAKVCGVTHNFISACEAGRDRLAPERLYKLLVEFDAPLEWLYFGWKRHLSNELRHKLDLVDQDPDAALS